MKLKLNKFRQIFILLFSCARGEAILLVLLSVFSGVYASLGVVLWKFIIDVIMEALQTKELRNVVLLVVCYFIYTALETVLSRSIAHVQWKYTAKLNIRLGEKIMDKSYYIAYEEFDKSDTYDTIRKVNNESITSISTLLQQGETIIQNVVSLISVIVILSQFSILFVVIAIAAIIPMIIIDVKMAEKLYELNNELTEPRRYADKFKGMLTDYLSIREIKVYKAFHYIKDKVVALQMNSYEKERKVKGVQLKVDIIMNTVFIFICYVLKLVTICASIVRTYTIGTITMYINALDMLADTLQMIVYNLAGLNENMLYINLLLNFLEKEEIKPGDIPLSQEINSIKFEQVSFRYHGQSRDTLQQVSFTLKKNTAYLLYGINGAGKSTILKLLLGLYVPTTGRILVDGIDLQDIDKDSYYDRVGVVFQEFNKYPMNVRENIALYDNGDMQKLEQAAGKVNADEFIQELDGGYESVLNNELKDGVQLSLGQWQKLAIARMLYRNAELYILDEPSASLDQRTTERLNRLLFGKSKRHTTIIVSHNEEIAQKVDEIIVLGNRQVLEIGSYQELMERKGYFYSNIRSEEQEQDENHYQ